MADESGHLVQAIREQLRAGRSVSFQPYDQGNDTTGVVVVVEEPCGPVGMGLKRQSAEVVFDAMLDHGRFAPERVLGDGVTYCAERVRRR